MRDYIEVVRKVEGYYPQSVGSAVGKDETLRRNLSGYYNQCLREIGQAQRWQRNFKATTITTIAGTALYTLNGGNWQTIEQMYWLDVTGRQVPVELVQQEEARAIFGAGPLPQQGRPCYAALMPGRQIQIFPVPDAAGPSSGNYDLVVEFYQDLPQIIETTGSTTATVGTVTVPSVPYLTTRGAVAANPGGDKISVRAAGYDGGLGSKDDFVEAWSAFPTPTTITVPTVPSTVASAQTFLYSTNWLIDEYPVVPLFAMLREVASYLKSKEDYSLWEGRFQLVLQGMIGDDLDARTQREVLASAVTGQRQPQFATRPGGQGWGPGWGGWSG